MIKQYLKILWRNTWNRPVYSAIIFIGLVAGLTASMMIYLWIYDELSYEKFHADNNRIYRVLALKKEGDSYKKTPNLPIPLAESLRENFANIEDATFIKYGSDTPLQVGDNTFEVTPAYVDKHFFNVFTGFEFIEGDIDNVLSDPGSIILSEKTTHLLFGDTNALGQIVSSNKFYNIDYKVAGVVKVPSRSHIDFGFLTLLRNDKFLNRTFMNNWQRSGWTSVYFKLNKDAITTDNFIATVSNHMAENTGKPAKLIFQPITNIHLFSDYSWFLDKNIGEYKYVLIFSGLALIIVIMASLNFTVLTTARASERFTEIAYRKVSGSSKKQLFFQFLLESSIPSLVALLVALVIAWYLIPWFNELTGKSIFFSISWKFILSLIAITLGVNLLSSLYPAVYITSFNPVLIFKGGSPAGSKSGFIKFLVITQFAITTGLLIFTLTNNRQMKFVENKELGIDKENIVVVPIGLWYDISAFKSELLQNPDILSVTASSKAPADFYNQIPFYYEGIQSQDSIYATLFWVDSDFAETYGLEIVQGNFLTTTYDDYWTRANSTKSDLAHLYSRPVVINETARNMMGIDDPIGLRFNQDFVVVGVVKDFHFRPLHNKINPMVMMYNPENIMTLNVKINPENKGEALAYLKETYMNFREERGYSYSFFEDEIDKQYQSEKQLEEMLVYFSVLGIIISMLGLFGMASFSTNRRIKEIGIRKINGAKTWDLLVLLNTDYLKWVLLSLFIGIPIGYYLVVKWLENFSYRTSISMWLIITCVLFTITIALLSVNWLCLKVARKNPVEALRYE